MGGGGGGGLSGLTNTLGKLNPLNPGGIIGGTPGNLLNKLNPLNPGDILDPKQIPNPANDLPGVNPPDYAGDNAQFEQLKANIGNLYNQQYNNVSNTYDQQAQAETGQINKQMGDMITNLTSSDPNSLGGQLQSGYNRLGLLNSGAFNQGLASQFTPIEQQATTDILNQGQQKFGDLRSILGQSTNTGVGLDTAQTQRQFSLEDWLANAQQQQKLAQMGVTSQTNIANQQGQNQLLSSLIGAGGTLGGAAIGK